MADKLNKDGLVPGQRVDAAMVAKVNRKRSLKAAEAKREASKPKPKSKAE